MITLAKSHSLISNWESVRPLLDSEGPESLREFRKRGIERFAAVGLPTTKDEEFKYLPLPALVENDFAHAYAATVERFEYSDLPLGALEAATLAFVNGEYAPELSNVSGLPNGVRVMSLREALEQHEGLVLRHLGKIATHEGKLGSTNDERFVSLNDAYLGDGAFVFVAKGVAVEPVIHVQFLNRADHGPFAAHPRVLIVMEEGAQAKVVESHTGLGDDLSFTNVVGEIWVGQHAILEHVKLQNEGANAVHIANVYAYQESDSTFTSNLATFGGAVGRTDVNAFSDGEHTETSLNCGYLGAGKQILDHHTRIDHAKPNCHSFEVYKGVLRDDAVGVFNGKIFVYEDAQKTDAKQTNQALLLSPTATINTKPQLEIFADDVKCTHGATIGQLQEDALFYLRARGIPEEQARALLVYAFAADVLDKISIEPVREAVEALLYKRLHVA